MTHWRWLSLLVRPVPFLNSLNQVAEGMELGDREMQVVRAGAGVLLHTTSGRKQLGAAAEFSTCDVTGQDNLHPIYPDVLPFIGRDQVGYIPGCTADAKPPSWDPIRTQVS